RENAKGRKRELRWEQEFLTGSIGSRCRFVSRPSPGGFPLAGYFAFSVRTLLHSQALDKTMAEPYDITTKQVPFVETPYRPIREAILDQVNSGLLHNYCFPSEERAALVEYLAKLAPPGLEKVFLLTTGAETTENAIKLARSWGQKIGGKRKIGIVTFQNAFHGRTMGAQQIGGFAGQSDWIVNLDPDIHHVPFPDGYRTEDTSFA